MDSGSLVSECSKSEAPKAAVITGRTIGPTRRSTKGKWTEEQDKLLVQTVKKFNEKNWKSIAKHIPGRTDVQCLHRWQKVLNPNLIKGAWTKEEDDKIIELVNKYGCKKWSIIAKSLPGRIGKQCRERYYNHLSPELKKGTWTTKEEEELIRAHQVHGNKWATIARCLPGRSENAIKNHWNCSLKKKLDMFSSLEPSDQQLHLSNFNTIERNASNMLAVSVGKETSEFSKKISSKELFVDDESSRRPFMGSESIPIHDSKSSKLEIQVRLQEDSRSPLIDIANSVVTFDNRELDDVSGNTHEATLLHPKLSNSFGEQNSFSLFQSHQTPYASKKNDFIISDETLISHCDAPVCADGFSDNILHGHDQTPPTPSFNGNQSFCPSGDVISWKPDICMQASCSFQCSPSSSLSLDVSSNVKDFQSCIRTAAKSFRNTPSIIRKRHQECLLSSSESSQQTDFYNDNSENVCVGSIDTILRLAPPPSESQTLGSKIEQVNSINSKTLKSNGLTSKKYGGKCLEHEFEAEWATTNPGPAAATGCTSLVSNFASSNVLHHIDGNQAN